MDTFVANDARVVGGAGVGASFNRPDDDGEEWNSLLLCTGANACGKVSRVTGGSLRALILIEGYNLLPERLFKAGR